MLKVKNLSKKIGNKIILNGLNFELGRGEIGVFLGGSGVGKSTLLRVLNNLETYDAGDVLLDEEILNLEKANKQHTVGMVFQQFNLFENLNVESNITLPLAKLKGMSDKEAILAAAELLAKYDLSAYAKAKVQSLSGGQKQRLAIARTVALNPLITCLDEPTSALDPRLTGQVAKCVKELANEDRIVLLSTHDMSLVEQLDCKIFYMHQGKIVESCAKEAYQADPLQYPLLQSFMKGTGNA